MAKTIYPTRIEIKTAPTTGLVALDVIKNRTRQSGTASDAILQQLIDSVSDAIEIWLGRPVREQDRIYHYSEVPDIGDFLLMPDGPVDSVNEVEVFSMNSWRVESNYREQRFHENKPQPPQVPALLQCTGTWPKKDIMTVDAVRVDATCGWRDIPPVIVNAATRQIVDQYVHHGMTTDIENFTISTAVTRLLHPYASPHYSRPWHGTASTVVEH